MPKGVYAAASAMVTESRALDVTARNLAHATTAGYRRETALRDSFANSLAREGKTGIKADGGAGVQSAGSYHSFSEGTRERTGAPFDLGLSGDGFYRVRHPDGRLLLTRAAHFQLDNQFRLTTPEGWIVEGQGGAITIPAEAQQVRVDSAGRVNVLTSAGGVAKESVLDQLRLAKVAKPSEMPAHNGVYFEPGGQEVADATTAKVHQGEIERGNVDPIRELVDMIALQRRYDAAQRSLKENANAGGGFSDILRS